MKALVIGLGISGRSAAQFLLHHNYEVVGVDSREEALQEQMGIVTQHDSDPIDWTQIDLVVLSPGVPPTHPLCSAAKESGIEVIGEVELAVRSIQQPCIGITGTNGKTTVTLLVEHVLNTCGIAARAVGNVGVPLTSEILSQKVQDQILVIELSSYQLETLQTPIFDIAAVLNITPDHLDRYPSMNEYVMAKARIKDCLKPGGMLYMNSHTLRKYGGVFNGAPVKSYSGETFEEENDEIACLLCRQFGVTKEQFVAAKKTFKKPPHRLEYVCTIDGVSYYNDSKGTNTDAVARAVQTLQKGIVLIAGGLDKGAPYTPWVDAFEGRVNRVCAIGEAAKKIRNVLSPHLPVTLCESLEHAVDTAAQFAVKGDSILLSPGCASFDMFRNFEERGETFKSIVEKKRIS